MRKKTIIKKKIPRFSAKGFLLKPKPKAKIKYNKGETSNPLNCSVNCDGRHIYIKCLANKTTLLVNRRHSSLNATLIK